MPMTRRCSSFLLALLSLIFIGSIINAASPRVKTKRPGATASVPAASGSIAFDTITPVNPGQINFSGYDKPLRSSRETFFATNATEAYIHTIIITTEYFDLAGRQLHKQSRRVAAQIPAGETRQLTMPSWDTQQSFYYHKSNPPRRANAYPYNIKITADTLFTTSSELCH